MKWLDRQHRLSKSAAEQAATQRQYANAVYHEAQAQAFASAWLQAQRFERGEP